MGREELLPSELQGQVCLCVYMCTCVRGWEVGQSCYLGNCKARCVCMCMCVYLCVYVCVCVRGWEGGQ